jgi:hypothetical protein
MGNGTIAPPFLTSALDGGEQSSRLGHFTPGERALGTHWLNVPQCQPERCEGEKNLVLPGFEPVALCCTD